jgi:flagellar secretion chaperone FliS
MNTQDSASAYQQFRAIGASPVGQVVALYDAILRDLHRAVQAIRAGRVEERVAAVNHALLVVSELQGVLDFERGGEPARNLDNFYKVVRNLILKGSMAGSAEDVQKVVEMVARIRAAWAKVETKVPNANTGQVEPGPAGAPGKPALNNMADDSDQRGRRLWRVS